MKNKTQEDSWLFRYYEAVGGKRVHKNVRIGGVRELPSQKDAENAVLARRGMINSGVRAPETVAELVYHYKQHELTLDRKAFATVDAHTSYLDLHILPVWGKLRTSEVRSMKVEKWLDELDRAPGTKTKIRNILSAVFTHGIRHEWLTHNPISKVRCSAKRLREPDVLTPEDFRGLLGQLEGAARVMVSVAGSTGMRGSELIALTWADVDFLSMEVRVIRSCVRNRFGDVKTAASKKPLPLHEPALRELSAWRATTPYSRDGDFIFPSVRMNGTQPLSPDMVLKKNRTAGFRPGRGEGQGRRLAYLQAFAGDDLAIVGSRCKSRARAVTPCELAGHAGCVHASRFGGKKTGEPKGSGHTARADRYAIRSCVPFRTVKM